MNEDFADQLTKLILESVRAARTDRLINSSPKRVRWLQALDTIGGFAHRTRRFGGPSNFELATLRYQDHARSIRLYELLQETGHYSVLHKQRLMLGETPHTEVAYLVNVIDTPSMHFDEGANDVWRDLISIESDMARRAAWVSPVHGIPIINVFSDTADELLANRPASAETLSIIRHEYIHTQRSAYVHRGATFGSLFDESLATLLSIPSPSYREEIALLKAIHLITNFDTSTELKRASRSDKSLIDYFRDLQEATGPGAFAVLMSMQPGNEKPFCYAAELGEKSDVVSQILGHLALKQMTALGPRVFKQGFAERLDEFVGSNDSAVDLNIVNNLIAAMNSRSSSMGLRD